MRQSCATILIVIGCAVAGGPVCASDDGALTDDNLRKLMNRILAETRDRAAIVGTAPIAADLTAADPIITSSGSQSASPPAPNPPTAKPGH